MWKRSNIRTPILCELREVVPHPLQNRDNWTSVRARERTTRQKENDFIKVYVCFLSFHDRLFLSIYLKRSTQFMVFNDYDWRVAAYFFLLSNQDDILYVIHFFSRLGFHRYPTGS